MKDSSLVQLKIRYARERSLEPPLPTGKEEHLQRVLEWRRLDREFEELVRALAGREEATAYAAVPWPPPSVSDPNRLIAAGADLVNGICVKVAWLEQFRVRLETREGLRDLRS